MRFKLQSILRGCKIPNEGKNKPVDAFSVPS